MNLKLKYQKLDKIYRQLPEVDCKGLCATKCGYFWAPQEEQDRLKEVYGFNPVLPKEEIRKGISQHIKHTCQALENGRCTVHPIRPLVCRVIGLSEKTKCPHGCKPTKVVSQEKVDRLMVKAKYFPKRKNEKQKA